jgi:hypothetical protein
MQLMAVTGVRMAEQDVCQVIADETGHGRE